MEKSDELRIQNQFGAFCTKVLNSETRMIHREELRQQKDHQSLDELAIREPESIAARDCYFKDEHIFNACGISVMVKDDQLAEAIARLPQEKQDVILLSYFLGWSDGEIGQRLKVVRQTISKRRNLALKVLRSYLMK